MPEQDTDQQPTYPQAWVSLGMQDLQHEVQEVEPGVYCHTFTPPEMTIEDVMRLINRIGEDSTWTL